MTLDIPEWLQIAKSQDRDSEDIYQAPDGTWTVWIDYGDVSPVHGLPTRAIAKSVHTAMWEMESAGASNYAQGMS